MIRTARERDVSTIGMPFAQHRATSDLDMRHSKMRPMAKPSRGCAVPTLVLRTRSDRRCVGHGLRVDKLLVPCRPLIYIENISAPERVSEAKQSQSSEISRPARPHTVHSEVEPQLHCRVAAPRNKAYHRATCVHINRNGNRMACASARV